MADEPRGRRGLSLAGQTGDRTPEFPPDADTPPMIGRRDLVKLIGASMALAGAGCAREPPGKIVPYTVPPPETQPGIARYYATSVELDGFATGLIVESHEGRPTKIEGNPAHPASLGATLAHEQAAILGLYDPSRARGLRRRNASATWDMFLRTFTATRADGGARLRFLLEPTGSPQIGDQIELIRARLPGARFTFYSPLRPGFDVEGARIAFGIPVLPQRDLSRAAAILSLDADFLASMPFSARYARQFSERRRVSAPGDPMSRLYVFEPTPTPTGATADHRIPTRSSEIGRVAAAVAAELVLGAGRSARGMPEKIRASLTRLRDGDSRLIQAMARDLAGKAGATAVIAGDRQPPRVHAIVHLLNALLDNRQAISAIANPLIDLGASQQDLATLAAEIQSGAVDTLVILEGNPAYSAPADLDFAALIARVPYSLYLGHYEDETAQAAAWFAPAAHFLESWGDARAYDGTTSLVQPLISPLFGGRSRAEILAMFTGESYPDAHALARASWVNRYRGADFDRFWEESLQAGVIAGTASPPVPTDLKWDAIGKALDAIAREPRPNGDALEIAFTADPKIYDGRFANNAWLQELPDPITKLTWDNAALVSPKTAEKLGVATEDVILVDLAGRKLEIPVLVVPGHADLALSLPLGYGREGAEEIARGVGANAYRLRTQATPFFAVGASVTKVPGGRYPFAITQSHWSVMDRPIALSTTLAALREDPHLASHLRGPQPSLFAPQSMEGEQWAMTIDMSICTGCSACVVACQAENNILVVGKEQVRNSREMHWLRIDIYREGDPDAPEIIRQPMLCQHCEKAPCEYVCPVNATVHSPDGLNEMAYNRCVGTRFCSNNCPYKVRRFNWFNWTAHEPINQGMVKLQRNPDVTVRQRGVMEKCTYCVQRIRETEIKARIEDRPIREGEFTTACAQACPTQAIQFGSLHHDGSKMVAWRHEPRSFAVLHELGTVPRTLYLADLKNPNPEIG